MQNGRLVQIRERSQVISSDKELWIPERWEVFVFLDAQVDELFDDNVLFVNANVIMLI